MANEVLEDDDRAMVSPTTPARRTSPSPRRERRRSRPRRPRRDANAVGEVELHEVVVREPEPNDGAEAGKTDELEEEVSSEESDSSASTDSVFFCRICLDAISPSVVERGDATHLGCAFVGGYMHRICALEYLSKKKATHALTCEVCLTQMTKLKSVQQDRLAERRRAGRARRALLTIITERTAMMSDEHKTTTPRTTIPCVSRWTTRVTAPSRGEVEIRVCGSCGY